MTRLLVLMLLALTPSAAMAAPSKQTKPAMPAAHAQFPGVDGVLAAFEEADLVTLGERPWSKLDADFRVELAMDPRFPDVVNDVVVEFATARYQHLLDAYVLDMRIVPPDSLSLIWRNGAEPGAWDSPVYAYFIDTIRRVNQLRPREKRVRILAGEPPYDWSMIQSAADLSAFGAPGAHALDVIGREVIAKGRKALLVYSARNFFRRDRALGGRKNLTLSLEAAHPDVRVFVVGSVPEGAPGAAALDSIVTAPSGSVLIRLDRSGVGAWSAERVYGFADGPLVEMADALLYFKAMDDRLERPGASVTRDAAYVQEVVRRKQILGR